jgi:hypothetical protein
MKDPRYATDPAFKAEVDKAASIGTPPEAAPAEQQDLGDGFVLTSVDLEGQQNPAVLDTQSNTYILRNKRADGSAIFRTPAPYILVKDGKPETTMKLGPASAAALQKAGLMNESASDTFAALYKQIKSIDENADVEECGMMPIVAGQSGQSDSVNMNVSLNASGGGGIRELMNVLKNIDDVAAPQHGDSDGHEDPMFGDSFEEEFGNSMAGHGGPTTAPVSAVLPTGDDMHSKGIEAKKVNGGGNPLARKSSMEESIVDQLQNLYTKIKNR